MNANNSIIAIRKKDIRLAHQAFADLMDKTENILNEEAFANPDEYKQLTSSSLESCAVEKIKLACADSPFDASEVELISGQRFPDIVAEKYYGIEVKSTKEDHWTSTGSSILETTRIENVDDIYMLFGKLGGNIPQFKCRPYQDVLYDIAVTHSPRYLINMEISTKDSILKKWEYLMTNSVHHQIPYLKLGNITKNKQNNISVRKCLGGLHLRMLNQHIHSISNYGIHLNQGKNVICKQNV